MESRATQAAVGNSKLNANELASRLQQISLILDPDGDGLKYTVSRSLNSDDCGKLARLLDDVKPTQTHVSDEFDDEDSQISVYKMSRFD